MQGDITIKVGNARVRYEFTLHRNVTVLQDAGATGKTSLVNMIAAYLPGGGTGISLTVSNGLDISVLNLALWRSFEDFNRSDGRDVKPQIFIVDESMPFIYSGDFANFVWGSGCYFILITRDNLPCLACSTKEVYKLQTFGKVTKFIQVYPDTVYGLIPTRNVECITEDSGFGKKFFARVYGDKNTVSANGKENVLNTLAVSEFRHPVVIVDGAAFGLNVRKVLDKISSLGGCLIAEESFEYVLLTSGIFSKYENQLKDAVKHIEAKEFKTWERFFTDFLEKVTNGTELHYKKDEFNPRYVLQPHVTMILNRYGLPILDDSDCTDYFN